jgi:hypothetical protein
MVRVAGSQFNETRSLTLLGMGTLGFHHSLAHTRHDRSLLHCSSLDSHDQITIFDSSCIATGLEHPGSGAPAVESSLTLSLKTHAQMVRTAVGLERSFLHDVLVRLNTYVQIRCTYYRTWVPSSNSPGTMNTQYIFLDISNHYKSPRNALLERSGSRNTARL